MNYFEQLILRNSASQAGHYGKNGQAIMALLHKYVSI